MKALKIILLIIVILIGLFFLVGAFLPNSLHMESSKLINKPASLLFKQVNNFQNWPAWSPWQEYDPAQVNTFEGPALGVGARTNWESKKNGNGSMTITESIPYSLVASDLDFGQRGKATNAFRFAEGQDGTTVTWSVDIPALGYPVGRYLGLMMPGMMSKFFDNGLANLEKVTREMPNPPAIETVELPEMNVISVRDSCSWTDIESKMGQLFSELLTELSKNKKASAAGYFYSSFFKWDEINQFTVFEAGVPISGEIKSTDRIVYKTLPATRAIVGTHFGPYDATEYLYRAMDEFVLEHGLVSTGGPLEMYITDPSMEPDTAKWQTNIYFPVK